MLARLAALLLVLAIAAVAHATGSGPIQVTPDGSTVWVVNPDSNTVAAIDTATNARIGEFPVGRYPRTVAVTSSFVYGSSARGR